MDRDYMQKILADALKDLQRAIDELNSFVSPEVPTPRPKRFVLFKNEHMVVVWPYIDDPPKFKVYWSCVRWENNITNVSKSPRIEDQDFPSKVLGLCKHQPAQVLRVLRQIRAAAAWCRARAEGRRRAAQEILRQQSRAVEALKAEGSAVELAR